MRLIPETEKPRQQKLFSISPSFVVDDVVKSAEYCRDVLGFNFNLYRGEPPCFVIVGRDSVEISLANPGASGLSRPNREAHPEATWDTYVMREIELQDCNGYVLCFGEDVPK